MEKPLHEYVKELEKRVAALEGQVQMQQVEFDYAIAFLFDRSWYKKLIRDGDLDWPTALTRALKVIDY